MRRFLLTHTAFVRDYGERFGAVCAAHGLDLEPLAIPDAPGARLDARQLDAVEIACYTDDFVENDPGTRRFLGCALRAPGLRWLHVPNAGIDHPVFGTFLARGVRLTTSSGANAEPVAHTVIGALLFFARGFPHWLAARERRAWTPHRPPDLPRDLRGQTLVVVGVGAIGARVAHLARTLGLRVIGVRRTRRGDEPVDELHPPAALPAVLPRADWLVLCCPLTPATRNLIDAAALARLPAHARLLNVGRGTLVDEAALVDALRSGRLGGAYLDVFATEPLPPDSPLWDLPGVIVTPHDAGAARGNRARVSELFLQNLERWARGAPLVNEATDTQG